MALESCSNVKSERKYTLIYVLFYFLSMSRMRNAVAVSNTTTSLHDDIIPWLITQQRLKHHYYQCFWNRGRHCDVTVYKPYKSPISCVKRTKMFLQIAPVTPTFWWGPPVCPRRPWGRNRTWPARSWWSASSWQAPRSFPAAWCTSHRSAPSPACTSPEHRPLPAEGSPSPAEPSAVDETTGYKTAGCLTRITSTMAWTTS